MANFSPGWNFSLVNRVETSARLLQQILLKSNCRLHGEVFSLGRNSARAENPSPLCSCSRCHFDSPETLRAQFHIFGAEANISARAEVRHVIATKFQPGQPGWNFSPGWNSPCNQALTRLTHYLPELNLAGLKKFRADVLKYDVTLAMWNLGRVT